MTAESIWFLIFIFISHLNGQRVTIWSSPLLNGSDILDFDYNTGNLVSDSINCPSGSSCYELKKDRQIGIWISTIDYHSIQLIYSIRTYDKGDSGTDYCNLWYIIGKYSDNWDDWTFIHSSSATMAPIIETIDFVGAENNQYFAFAFYAQTNLGDRCWFNYLNLTGIPISTTIEPTMEPTINPTMKSTEIESTNTEQTELDQTNISNTTSIMTTGTTLSIKSTQIGSTNIGQTIASDTTLEPRSTAISISTMDGVDMSNKSQLINGINDIIYIVIGLFICCCCICIGFMLLYRKRMVQPGKCEMQNEIKMSTPMASMEKQPGNVELGSIGNSNLNEENEENDVVVIQIKQTKMSDNQTLSFIDYHENEGKNMNMKLVKYIDDESDNDDELYVEQGIDVKRHKITTDTDDGNMTQQNEPSISSHFMKNNDIYTTTTMQHVVSGEGIVKY